MTVIVGVIMMGMIMMMMMIYIMMKCLFVCHEKTSLPS